MKTIKHLAVFILIAIASVSVLCEEPDLLWQILFVCALMALGWLLRSDVEKIGQRHANKMGEPTVFGGRIYYPRRKK